MFIAVYNSRNSNSRSVGYGEINIYFVAYYF